MSKLHKGFTIGGRNYPDVAIADDETPHAALTSYNAWSVLGKLVWGGRRIKDGKLSPTLAGKSY